LSHFTFVRWSRLLCTFELLKWYTTAMLSPSFVSTRSILAPSSRSSKLVILINDGYRSRCVSTIDASHVTYFLILKNITQDRVKVHCFYRFRPGYSVDTGVIDLLGQGAAYIYEGSRRPRCACVIWKRSISGIIEIFWADIVLARIRTWHLI